MKPALMRGVLLTAALLMSLAHAEPPPVEAYGQRPATIDVVMNPAGTRLAWIEDDGKGTRLIVHDLAAQKALHVLKVAEPNRLRRVYWAGDGTVLLDQRVTMSFDNDRNTYEWQRWTAFDVAAGKDQMLLMKDGRQAVTGATLVRRLTSRPGKAFMSTLDFNSTRYREETGTRLAGGRKDSGWISNLYEVDLGTGDAKALAAGSPFTSDWLADADAKHILRSEWNPKSDQFEILVNSDNGWRGLYKSAGCGRMSLIAFSNDNSAVYLLGSPCGEARDKLFSLNLETAELNVVVEDPAVEVEGVLYDPLDERLLGVTLGGTEQSTRWLDEQAQRRSEGLHRSFKNSTIWLTSRSTDGKRLVVLVENARSAPVYYLIDYSAKTADIINERYPKLTGVALGPVREFQYKARDRYSLIAYLTVPAGAQEKGLPLVVMPHGGPEARDEPGFDYFTQFLASRGYAVLQPQFRGSTGFGRAHADAGRQQWGLRMQDDVTDGVNALVEQGIADPRRICIVGASYGGYAALAGAAFTPDLYTCAASIAGVADLPAMIGSEGKSFGKESNSLAYWKEHIGSATSPQVIAKSPARSAASIKVPILLIHGTDDTIVPIEQSRTMARALTAAGKKFQFVELEGDDHFLSMSETRVRTLRELEKFLAAHLGTTREQTPAPGAGIAK